MTTTIDIETITQSVREALSHRDSRRDALAQRIRDLAQEAMDALRVQSINLYDPDSDCGRLTWVIEYRTPVGDCSQWANRTDYPDHRGDPCLMLRLPLPCKPCWRSLGPVPDVGFFDGHNRQHQRGPTRELETGRRIHPATVAQLTDVARALPRVLAELLAEARDHAQRETVQAEDYIRFSESWQRGLGRI